MGASSSVVAGVPAPTGGGSSSSPQGAQQQLLLQQQQLMLHLAAISPASPAPSASNSAAVFVPELLDLLNLTYEKSLGSSRFLKTVKCRHATDGSALVVKAFLKPLLSMSPAPPAAQQHQQQQLLLAQDHLHPSDQLIPMSLKSVIHAIQEEASILVHIPNAFPYLKAIETARAGYLVRQFLYSNLYDRIRPFLTFGEKIWIAFQILTGLSQAHANNIFHGDIKTENILVTSWNWAYICDFSSYKPVHLPEDNPTDFNFFFDSSSRRSCYIAPERFLAPGETLFLVKPAELTAEMDIFAAGCTIAEMFLEGASVFTLSQLLRFRRGEYDPNVVIDKIENEDVRELLKSMINIDPRKRKSADTYLSEFLSVAPSTVSVYSSATSLNAPVSPASVDPPEAGPSVVVVSEQLSLPPMNADMRIEKIFVDFWRVVEAAGIPAPKVDFAETSSNDTCMVLTTIICTALRNTRYSSSRIMALELLLVLGIQLSDEERLDRIVPYVIQLLSDEAAVVRVMAVKVLAQLLSMVESITTADVTIFQEYILPALKPLATDDDLIVKITYASCIATIAETALRFLELSQLFQQNFNDLESDGDVYQLSYDVGLHELHEAIQSDVAMLISDPNTNVKRALLHDMARLCIFFGKQRANDVLLGHTITYLNDKDWRLR
ncbi:Serine/threonine-protein kinase, partial [Entophlyctis luteolus]